MAAETQQPDPNPEQGSNYIRIASVGRRSVGYDLKLRSEDVVAAINGAATELDIGQFEVLMKSAIEEPVLLTIYRKGHFFETLVPGPLGCMLEYAQPEVAQDITEALKDHQIYNFEEYRQFEALRNINRHVCLIDTDYSVMATMAPALWLLYLRMWAPFATIIATYAVSAIVHPVLFMLVYILTSIYFHKGHLQLLRGYYLYTEHYFWMKFAAVTDKHAQEICRRFDPKCRFDFSHVGEPEKDKNGKNSKNGMGASTPSLSEA